MNELEFKRRTKQLALRVIDLAGRLPGGRTSDVIGRQVIRSATSIGADYRAACRGRSSADLINKLAIVEEEGDETCYWLELLVESGLVPSEVATPLLQETNEIVAMTVASIRTPRQRI